MRRISLVILLVVQLALAVALLLGAARQLSIALALLCFVPAAFACKEPDGEIQAVPESEAPERGTPEPEATEIPEPESPETEIPEIFPDEWAASDAEPEESPITEPVEEAEPPTAGELYPGFFEALENLKGSPDMDELRRRAGALYTSLDGDSGPASGGVADSAAESAAEYIRENYADPALSVETICAELGKSRGYLSRCFKESTGTGLLDFLHRTRLAEAKRLLRETELSVGEISEKAGYYNAWSLSRVFRRYEGMTPSAYRGLLFSEGKGGEDI